MTKDEALKLALDALERTGNIAGFAHEREQEAITAIKQARALDKMAENARELGLDYEPVQEPVVWEQFYPDIGKTQLAYSPPTPSPDNACYIPPAAQRTWVGLTDEELLVIYNQTNWNVNENWNYEKAIEAKLKEKNT
jgi:hypothetical protein